MADPLGDPSILGSAATVNGDWLALFHRHRIADMLQWAHHDRPSGCWLAPVTTTTSTTPAGPGTCSRRSSLQSAPNAICLFPPKPEEPPPIHLTGSDRPRRWFWDTSDWQCPRQTFPPFPLPMLVRSLDLFSAHLAL